MERNQRDIQQRPVPDTAKLIVLAFQLFASGDYFISSLTETMQKKGE